MLSIPDLNALIKPRVTTMVVLTTALGYLLATSTIDAFVLVHAVFGTALLAAGSSILNQVFERRTDGLMVRTRERPLPTGRVSPEGALTLALILTAAGLAELVVWVNLLTAALGATTTLLYVFVYTPLKRRSSLATLVGAIPGAVPPMMGVSAATDALPPLAWVLFGLLFLWQMPHFLAIAWLYRDDYEAGGMPMLSVNDPKAGRTARQAVLYAATLIPVSLLPNVLGLAGAFYFVGAMALGLIFLWYSFDFGRKHDHGSARRLLLASVVYLPIMLLLMVLNRQT